MKKLISILFVLILLCSFPLIVFAEEARFDTAKDLFNYWEAHKDYPDYVCGVWTTDGSMKNLTISVLNTEEGNKGKQEILDLVRDDSTVTFAYGDYSRDYLREVQDSFTREMFQELGLSYTAFLDDKSRIELGIIKDKKDDPVAIKKLEEIKEQYGDVFLVKYVDGFVSDGSLLIEDLPVVYSTVDFETQQKPSYFVYIAIAVLLLLSVACLYILAKQRKALLLQTDTGHVFNATVPLSAKEVENIVRNTELEVPSDLDKKVMKEIENKK